MSAPEPIQIGPILYAVVMDDDLNRVGSGLMGQLDTARETIRLSPQQGTYQLRETLWHEVIHGILLALGIRHTEQMTIALSMLSLDVLQRNPALVTFLTDMDAA
jgi:hypothetical protein